MVCKGWHSYSCDRYCISADVSLPKLITGISKFDRFRSRCCFILAVTLLTHLTSIFISVCFWRGIITIIFYNTPITFFGVNPAIENNLIEIILLVTVTTVHLYISYNKKSVYLSSIGITIGCVTTLISNDTYSVFVFSVLLSMFIVYLKLKFEWNGFFIYGISLVYLTTLLWFINNPLLGNNVELRSTSPFEILSILIFAIIFASGNFFRAEKESENNSLIVSTILNCFLSYTLFLLFTMTKHKDALAIFHLSSSIIFLIIATLYWIKSESKFSTFFYSIARHTALSVAIVAQFPKPDFFVWLCWQSLLVVSTALWFRSKIIIVANFVMYLLIFIFYLALAGAISTVSLSFGLVALITARILNWQKNRLELKTEIMRLSYLGAAFFIFPMLSTILSPKIM